MAVNWRTCAYRLNSSLHWSRKHVDLLIFPKQFEIQTLTWIILVSKYWQNTVHLDLTQGLRVCDQESGMCMSVCVQVWCALLTSWPLHHKKEIVYTLCLDDPHLIEICLGIQKTLGPQRDGIEWEANHICHQLKGGALRDDPPYDLWATGAESELCWPVGWAHRDIPTHLLETKRESKAVMDTRSLLSEGHTLYIY